MTKAAPSSSSFSPPVQQHQEQIIHLRGMGCVVSLSCLSRYSLGGEGGRVTGPVYVELLGTQKERSRTEREKMAGVQ